jgi:hypothetical protein
MKLEDYQAAVVGCALVARILQQWNLGDVLEAIERVDIIGPLVDPTLWAKKIKAMAEDRELLKAAFPLWKLGKQMGEKQSGK